MKKIYTARDPAEANIIRGMLRSHGLEVEVRGEHLWGARGLIPMTSETAPAIWVLDDADAERAVELIRAVERRPDEATPWTCERCGEDVEGELGECWSCGTERGAE